MSRPRNEPSLPFLGVENKENRVLRLTLTAPDLTQHTITSWTPATCRAGRLYELLLPSQTLFKPARTNRGHQICQVGFFWKPMCKTEYIWKRRLHSYRNVSELLPSQLLHDYFILWSPPSPPFLSSSSLTSFPPPSSSPLLAPPPESLGWTGQAVSDKVFRRFVNLCQTDCSVQV